MRPRFTARRWLKLGSAPLGHWRRLRLLLGPGGGCGCGWRWVRAAERIIPGVERRQFLSPSSRGDGDSPGASEPQRPPHGGRHRARNIAAPPLRRQSAALAHPPPPERRAGSAAPRTALPIGAPANGRGGGNRLPVKPTAAASIGLSSPLVAIFVYVLCLPARAASTQMLSSTW